MSRAITFISSFAACIVCGQTMQWQDVGEATWNPFDRSEAPKQDIELEKRINDLEDRFIDVLVTVYDGDMNQSNENGFMDDCEGLKVDLTKMDGSQGASELLSRVESCCLQIFKAQHLKGLFLNGASPKGPNEIFVINETTPFQPPWGWQAMELAEWYMSKVVALDAMSEAAIRIARGQGLDLAYHYAHKFELAISFVLTRANTFNKQDAATALAKKTMAALTTHLTHLEKDLHNNGALPNAYFKSADVRHAENASAPIHILDQEEADETWNPSELSRALGQVIAPEVAPEERMSYLEDHLVDALVTVYDGGLDQSNVTRFMEDCEGFKVDLTKMDSIKFDAQILLRVELTCLQIHKAQHLKDLFLNGSSLNGSNEIFVINETTPFEPPLEWQPMEVAEWYMSKVVTLDAMSEHAIRTARGEGLDLAYNYAYIFQMAISLVLTRPSMINKLDAGTALAQKTMEALVRHLTHLEVSLRNNGALPGASFLSRFAEKKSTLIHILYEEDAVDGSFYDETVVDDGPEEESAVDGNSSEDGVDSMVPFNEESAVDGNFFEE